LAQYGERQGEFGEKFGKSRLKMQHNEDLQVHKRILQGQGHWRGQGCHVTSHNVAPEFKFYNINKAFHVTPVLQ